MMTLEELAERASVTADENDPYVDPGQQRWLGEVTIEDGEVLVSDDDNWSVHQNEDPEMFERCLTYGLIRHVVEHHSETEMIERHATNRAQIYNQIAYAQYALTQPDGKNGGRPATEFLAKALELLA